MDIEGRGVTRQMKCRAGSKTESITQETLVNDSGTSTLNCPLNKEYTDGQWSAFLACAKEGFKSGQRLDKEFYTKIGQHPVSERDVDLAIRRGSCLLFYKKDGSCKLGLWDPRSEVFVIAKVETGRIFNAFRVSNIDRYARSFDDVQWLRR